MPEGFAGFQTQLSETFNKRRDAGDNLLEAFLDANGRLAFRFVDEGGNAISQPRVTTPGFVRPALGITPPTLPSPGTSGGLASPTTSGGLITDPGGSGGDPSDAPDAGDPAPGMGIGTAIGNAAAIASGFGIPVALARAIMNKKSLTLKSAITDAISPSPTVSPTRGPDVRGSQPTVSPTRGPDIRGSLSNTNSVADLDGMSSSGTAGVSESGVSASATSADPTGQTGASASGMSADPGGAEGGGGTGGGACCFIAGVVVIMADKTLKKIEDVVIGDKVRGKDKINTVVGLNRPLLENRPLISLNGSMPFVTWDHPFWDARENVWRCVSPTHRKNTANLEIRPLEIGNTIVTLAGEKEITELNSSLANHKTQLYDLKLDGDSTYFANNYLVHNC